MTAQKFIQYNSLDLNGQILNDEHKLELNILQNSGNYLVHKDILRHHISQKQSTSSTKTRSEVRGGVVNLGNKKVLAKHVQDRIVRLYGKVVVLFSVLNQKQMF